MKSINEYIKTFLTTWKGCNLFNAHIVMIERNLLSFSDISFNLRWKSLFYINLRSHEFCLFFSNFHFLVTLIREMRKVSSEVFPYSADRCICVIEDAAAAKRMFCCIYFFLFRKKNSGLALTQLSFTLHSSRKIFYYCLSGDAFI